MATRTPKPNLDRQTDLRNSGGNRDVGTDWTVFHSMREFWFWVAIVTLIIFCLMGLSFAIIHVNKQINKAEALLVRIEEKERKQKLLPKADDE